MRSNFKTFPQLVHELAKAEKTIKTMRETSIALFILLICSSVFGMVQYARLTILQNEVAEGNLTVCDEGYVAKIVDGSTVTCVMTRIGPATVTHRVVKATGSKFYKRVAFNRKGKDDEEKTYDDSIFRHWSFNGGVRKPTLCSAGGSELQQRSRCGMPTRSPESHWWRRDRLSSNSLPSLRHDSE